MPSAGTRLKVLISAYACEPGKGSEPEVGWQVALHMAERHDVTVVTRANNRENIERGLATHTGPRPEFIYYDLPPWFLALKKRGLWIPFYYFLWQSGVRIFLHERLEEFDLVHHATFNSFRQPGCWWFCRRPVVLGPLGGGQICPWRHLPWFRRSIFYELVRSTSVISSYLLPNVPLSFYFADKILVANMDTWRCVPWAFRDRLEHLLETAVHPSQIVESRPPKTWGGVRFLWIARLDKRKGGELAVRAFAETRKRYDNITLTMVGRGEEEGPLRRLAGELGVGDVVEFIPSVPKEAIRDLMLGYDVFLFTSMRDTSGNVILEAMAASLPVITLNHQGAAEITTPETAMRVPVGKFHAIIRHLSGAMATLAGSRAWREELGNNGRERVRALYTWPAFAARMDTIYRQAVNEHAIDIELRHRKARTLLSPKGVVWSALVLLLIGVLAFSSLRYLKKDAGLIVNDTLPGLSYAGTVNSTLTDSFNRTLLAILAENEEERRAQIGEIHRLSAQTTESLGKYEAVIFSEDDRRQYGKLVASRNQYLAIRDLVLEQAGHDRQAEALRIYKAELAPAFEQVKQAGRDLLQYNIAGGQERGRHIIAICRWTQISVAVLGVVLFLAGFAVGFFK